MEIYIDESGSFVSAGAGSGSWCVVCAYMLPDSQQLAAWITLKNLKRAVGEANVDEIKLKNIPELKYFEFLRELQNLEGIAFVSATESSKNDFNAIEHHRSQRCAKLKEDFGKITNPKGQKSAASVVKKLEGLPAQLYLQLCIQIELVLQVINRGIIYYIQREPASLGHFRWRFDAKDPVNLTKYEQAFQIFCPLLLQTISLREPMPHLIGEDYSSMDRFLIKVPSFLIEAKPNLKGKSGYNINQIFREDLGFSDSRVEYGLQIADLLSAGFRRLLRLEFKDNIAAAQLLGSFLIQAENSDYPIDLQCVGAGYFPERRLLPFLKVIKSSVRRMVK